MNTDHAGTSAPTATLGTWAAGLAANDIPIEVRERVALLLLDTIASAIAGRKSTQTAQIEAAGRALAPGDGAVVIAGPRMSPIAASFVNAYQVTAANLCDVYRPSLCHVTPEVVPPALAAAAGARLSGRDLITALAAGLETIVRVGDGLHYTPFRERGWHSPGVIGPFGGAVSSGRIIGLNAQQMTRALSLAGSQSAGTFGQWGTPGVKFHQARGSMAGLIASRLAEQDFIVADEILVAEDGGLLGTYSDGGSPELLTEGLGERWALEKVSVRLWPAASSIQGVLSAVFDIIEQHDVAPADVSAMRVFLSESNYDMHGEMPFDSRFRALLSTRYCTSVVLHDRRCWLDQFTEERIADAAVQEFATNRISVAADAAVPDNGARIEIDLVDGRTVSVVRDVPHGDPADPATLAEVEQKFRMACEGVLPDGQAEKVLQLLLGIEDVADVDSLLVQLGAV